MVWNIGVSGVGKYIIESDWLRQWQKRTTEWGIE